MKAETRIYSDFIKRNKIVVGKTNFSDTNFAFYYKGELKVIPLRKCDETGKYFAGDDDASLTKKSAVYFYCKNHFEDLL